MVTVKGRESGNVNWFYLKYFKGAVCSCRDALKHMAKLFNFQVAYAIKKQHFNTLPDNTFSNEILFKLKPFSVTSALTIASVAEQIAR